VSREALLDPAPPEIINVTRGHLRSDEEEIIRVAADVLPDGAFGPQWVIATRARVMAVARKRVIASTFGRLGWRICGPRLGSYCRSRFCSAGR